MSQAEAAVGSVRGRVVRARVASFLQQQGALAALVALLAFASYRYDNFLTPENLTNVLRQNSTLALVALGMTFVILTGGIDLSVGSIVAVAAVASAVFAGRGWPVAVAAGVASGAAVGLINGLVIAKARIQPFIVTLAMMIAARGAVLLYTGEKSVSAAASARDFRELSRGGVDLGAFSLPYPILIFVAAYVVGWLVLNYTRFGRHV
jgi:ribose/xylose/arabinose/galactoside ABC-type transport system permease subunit